MTAQLEIISQVDFERIYTLAEFLTLDLPGDENDGDTIKYELVEGKLLAKAKGGVSAAHGEVVATLSEYLRTYTRQKQLGKIYSGASCTLGATDPKASWVEPDVCFVAAGRTPDDFDGPIPVAPDLIVEVHSPSDTTKGIQNKIETYQNAGVSLIWSVYLLAKYVVVHRLNDPDIKLFNLFNGELEGDPVLPGFKLSVKDLFQ